MDGSVRVVLSEREATAHRLHVLDGMSLSEAGASMGKISKQRVSQLAKSAKLKLAAAGDRPVRLMVTGMDEPLPEIEYFRTAAAGLKLDSALAAAIERRYLHGVPVEGDGAALRELSNAAALGLIDDRLLRLFDYLDDYAMARSTGPQIVKMIEQLVGMRQLLKGLPTKILDVNDRRSLNEVGRMLAAELERRAAVPGASNAASMIDVTPEMVE